jgi:phosphate-selective porin OprO and OprP
MLVMTGVIVLAAMATLAQATQNSTTGQSPGTTAAQASQAPAAPADAPPKPAPPGVTAGWRDGFYIQSEKADFRLQIGGLAHLDGRFAPGDDGGALAVNDTFLIRRLRPYLRGRVAGRFEFFFNPDFGNGAIVVQDAYVDTIFAPAFRVRVGKGKSPFGFERLQPAGNLLFVERAMPTSVAPNRDVGVQILGDVFGGRLSYLGGVMNGVPDGTSGDVDNGDSKDFVGRIVVKPFAHDRTSRLQQLTLAFSGSVGDQSGLLALPVFRTVSVQQPYFSYIGASADGVRTRYSPQFSYTYDAFGGWAEYVHSTLPIRKDAVVDDIAHDAWQVAGWIVLTGEKPTDATGSVRPRANFDFGHGHFGAIQIAARYHALYVDRNALTLGLAAAGSSRMAEAWTAGVNWYLTANFKYVFNFERTVFDDGAGPRPPENAFVFRTQAYF